MKALPFTLITDCRDDNALSRVTARMMSLRPVMLNRTIGVASDFEAALNLVDQVDALDGSEGIIFVNVAPRNDHAKKWTNGTPFGWVTVGRTEIFGTIAGYTFSLLQKFLGKQLVINTFDIPTVVQQLGLSQEKQDYITSTQFRSFEFLPRVADAVLRKELITSMQYDKVPKMPAMVAWADCFGNVKTSLFPEEVGFRAGKEVTLFIKEEGHEFTCYDRLKDIPSDGTGVVIGSSGMWQEGNNKRLLEIVINGGSAADAFKLHSGDRIEQE